MLYLAKKNIVMAKVKWTISIFSTSSKYIGIKSLFLKESRTRIILLLKYWPIFILVVKYLCPWTLKWIYPSPPLGPGTVGSHDPETVWSIPCTVRCLWDPTLPLRSASSLVGLADCISHYKLIFGYLSWLWVYLIVILQCLVKLLWHWEMTPKMSNK